jgi:hypothetical protein
LDNKSQLLEQYLLSKPSKLNHRPKLENFAPNYLQSSGQKSALKDYVHREGRTQVTFGSKPQRQSRFSQKETLIFS